jgi:hypothetical protein
MTPTPANPIYRGETCRACNAELVFLLTAKGRREPLEHGTAKTWSAWDELLDHEGAPLAALRLVAIVNGQPQSLGLKAARELGFDVEAHPETLVHVAHFATCPERDRFRRR